MLFLIFFNCFPFQRQSGRLQLRAGGPLAQRRSCEAGCLHDGIRQDCREAAHQTQEGDHW